MEELTRKTYSVLYCAGCRVELPLHWEFRPRTYGNTMIKLTIDNETNEIVARKIIPKKQIRKRNDVYSHYGKDKKKFCFYGSYMESNRTIGLDVDGDGGPIFNWDPTDQLVRNTYYKFPQ